MQRVDEITDNMAAASIKKAVQYSLLQKEQQIRSCWLTAFSLKIQNLKTAFKGEMAF
jgi:hypothetical protein